MTRHYQKIFQMYTSTFYVFRDNISPGAFRFPDSTKGSQRDLVALSVK